MFRKKFIRASIVAVLGMLIASGSISTTISAWSGGNSGSGGGGESGGCIKTDVKNWYNDQCFGASWRIYDANSDSIPIYYDDGKKQTQVGTVSECKKWGGKYYRLGYEKFRGTYGSFKGIGSQNGLLQVKQITNGGGWIPFKENPLAPNGERWADVEKAFMTAQKMGATKTTWAETSWFCYDSGWDAGEAQSSFDAWSFVDELSTASIGPDQRITKTIETTDDTVTVKFKHQFSYNKPTLSTDNSFGPAETTWYTEVRENGEYKSGTNKTVFRLNNSGPSRNSIWDDMPFLGESTYIVKVPEEEGAEVTVCSTIFYAAKTIGWKETSPKQYTMDASKSSGNADSAACVVVRRGTKAEESAGHIRFWSRSSITTNSSMDIFGRTVSTRDGGEVHDDSLKEDDATLRISTEQERVTVKFSHKLGFVFEDDNNQAIDRLGSKDRFKQGEKVYTKYDLDKTQTTGRTDSGEYVIVPPLGPTITTKGEKTMTPETNYTFNLARGETKKVCEKISYTPRIVNLKREEVTRKVPVLTSTSTDTGQGVFIVEFVDDPDQANAVVGDQLVKYRSANSSEYMHSEPVIHQEEWGPSVEWVERPGGKTGMSIWSTNGQTLYTFSFVGTDNYNQSLYADKWVDVWSGEYYLYGYGYIGGDSPHHYNDNGQLVSGVDPWSGWGVSSQGNMLLVREQREIHDYWIYSVESTIDDGYSEACIEVTRPALIPSEDSSDDIGSTTNSGNSKIGIMYAGEHSNMRWGVEAEAYPTRRIMEWKAVVLQINVNQDFNAIRGNALKGNILANSSDYINNNLDPCLYVRNRTGITLRNGLCSDAVAYDDTIPLNGFPSDGNAKKYVNKVSGMSVLVPDEVGDKYCTTSGLRWQYWYIIERKGVIDEEKPENGIAHSSYWANYGISCSTIAKKPSVSIVNGGILTNGDIRTSLASRYGPVPTPLFGQRLCSRAPTNCYYPQTFGSWTEYLASINGSPNNIGSGAAFAWDGSNTATLLTNSPLTIQNVNSTLLGYSGISSYSTTTARLDSYFSKSTSSMDELMSMADNVTGTHIIYVEGDVTIDRPIKVSNAAVDSIYQLPQVIIYATGDINIDPSVERIDAWLIAGKKVNTCNGWVSGNIEDTESRDNGTEAHIKGYNNRDTTTCAKQLVINGPVFAESLETHRSFGAGRGETNDDEDSSLTYDTRAVSGEVFNLSADTYLWAYAQAGRYDSSYTEAYSRELPPRY